MSETMVLVINTGSSSIKMALVDMPSEHLFAEGDAERLGEAGALMHWQIAGKAIKAQPAPEDHSKAMQAMLNTLFSSVDRASITAAGHRVVHGGEQFIHPTLLDDAVIAAIESLSHLAPLHNPANLLGIRSLMQQLPDIPHIAVFDTAFHHAMPSYASLYAVPYAWYSEHGVRRYGFHGSSHHYVAEQAAVILGRDFSECRLLTAHLGNGCSAAAIVNGASVDTTMGLTPLEGLVMGTRSGDVDPGLHEFMARVSGDSLATVSEALNRQSGLLGISGISNDMRILLDAAAAGDERAELAVEIFCYRLAKSLAGLAVALGHIDALVFTGGIGEHAAVVRARTVSHLVILGAEIDAQRNQQHGRYTKGFISSNDAQLPLLVVATSEEKMIARYVCERLEAQESSA